MTDDNQENDSNVVDIQHKPGRPKRDWDRLYVMWRNEGFPSKNGWLKGKGVNIRAGATALATREWETRQSIDTGVPIIMRRAGRPAGKGGKGKARVEMEPTSPIPDEAMPGRSTEPVDVKLASRPSEWEIIRAWRRKQSSDDYKTADTVRSICKLMLKKSITKVIGPNGEADLETDMTPREVSAIMDTLTQVQRVQRLALGMSTENVGVDQPIPQPDQSHIEKPKEEEYAIPTFVVEMSSKGKFLLPRPRRVS